MDIDKEFIECMSKIICNDIDLKDMVLPEEYFYNSLTFCVIDAVFSINAHYTSTTNVVNRYAEHFDLKKYRSRDLEGYPKKEEQESLDDLIKRIKNKSDKYIECFTKKVFKNKQRTSPSHGMLKTKAVYKFSKVLVESGIHTFNDIKKLFCCSKEIECKIKDIKGQGSGLSFTYFLMLVGNDNLIKPDRMILGYLKDRIKIIKNKKNIKVCPKEANTILSRCCEILKEDYKELTLRKLDYKIWEFQRKKKCP